MNCAARVTLQINSRVHIRFYLSKKRNQEIHPFTLYSQSPNYSSAIKLLLSIKQFYTSSADTNNFTKIAFFLLQLKNKCFYTYMFSVFIIFLHVYIMCSVVEINFNLTFE